MPKMDGFELYEEIKKKDNNANVYFLTASDLYYEEFRKKEYCVLDKNLFIRKPIDDEELIKEINKHYLQICNTILKDAKLDNFLALCYIQENPAISFFCRQSFYCFFYIVKLKLFPYFDV